MRVNPILLAALWIAACLPGVEPSALSVDSGGPTVPVVLRVFDTLGGEHDRTAIPRRPRLDLASPFTSDDLSTYPVLFRGPFDATLDEDARRAPWSRDALARVVEVVVATAGRTLRIEPRSPLVPGSEYTLVVPAWSHAPGAAPIGTPVACSLRVAQSAAGAAFVESFPASGSVGVPRQLEAIFLAFDDTLEPDLSVTLSSAGGIVAGTAHQVACEVAGLGSIHLERTCVQVDLGSSLASVTKYQVEMTAIHDRFGDSVAAMGPTFTTGDFDTSPAPRSILTSCALDERLIGVGCVLEQDDTIVLRARLDSPALVTSALGSATATSITRAGDVRLVFGSLSPGVADRLVVERRSLSGALESSTHDVSTCHTLPRIVIDEIRADSVGPEPAQEYVELWNLEPFTVDLSGYRLTDDEARIGDTLPPGSLLPPGARALVVADTFNALDARDVQPAPGVPLFRIGASLGSGGLTNSGEPLILRDTEGRRVSEAPVIAAPGPGRCVSRTTPFARAPGPADYAPSQGGGCTPGAEDPEVTP